MFRSITSDSTGDFSPSGEASPDAGRRQARRNAWRGLASLVRAGIAAIAEWRSLRRAARDLEGLDSRMLKDIGISRTEIGRVVRYGRSIEVRALGTAAREGARL